ncbi:HlyD family efflux transporter periplasmic adaptor subunit [Bacteroides caecigallinarum]|uniref:HlyD family secretion protein n=1 Tax=Bacteroides caecigallinarum TaxID=1411144 RepID=UPI0019581CB7|nr:HlyD family efflux transporter periplasmic adaptor subunit [Bacteroides caecigallinarum]MBM6864428.1 HlyD family efflux transporter periplasmic adaptor subunit [Bacteroides caecigallinarum]
MRYIHFILGVAALLSACSGNDNKFDASGVFEVTEVMVSARVAGEIMDLDVEEGTDVVADKPIGYIDTVQLYLQKLQLEANVKAAESRICDVEKQTAALLQQIDTQKKEQTRTENLVKANAGNRKHLDDITAAINLLRKQLDAQEETLVNNNANARAQAEAFRAQIALTDDMIRKSIISSPIDGTVMVKYVEKGELAVQGRTLFKVANINDMYLKAYITSGQISGLKIDQEVKVYADSGDSDRREYRGVITWISDKAEFTPKTIQTRDERANLVYAVKIRVQNDGFIKRGMYGEVSF